MSTNLKIVSATNWLQGCKNKPSYLQIGHSLWPCYGIAAELWRFDIWPKNMTTKVKECKFNKYKAINWRQDEKMSRHNGHSPGLTLGLTCK